MSTQIFETEGGRICTHEAPQTIARCGECPHLRYDQRKHHCSLDHTVVIPMKINETRYPKTCPKANHDHHHWYRWGLVYEKNEHNPEDVIHSFGGHITKKTWDKDYCKSCSELSEEPNDRCWAGEHPPEKR